MPTGPCDSVPFEKSSERFQLLVDAVSDNAIYMLDPRRRVITWNSGGSQLKGHTAAEATGLDYACFFTPDDRAHDVPA